MTAETRLAARVALVVGGLGAVAVLVAWAGSSATPLVGRQAGWGAIGVSGTLAVTAASFLWVATRRQAVARRATDLRTAILAGAEETRRHAARRSPVGRDSRTAAMASAGSAEFVAGAAMVHYHRAGCRLADGKPVEATGRVEHERAGRTPCGICLEEAAPAAGSEP
jgi:hypothetical protein